MTSRRDAVQHQSIDTLREQRQVLFKLRDLHMQSAVDVAKLVEARGFWADEKEDLTSERAKYMRDFEATEIKRLKLEKEVHSLKAKLERAHQLLRDRGTTRHSGFSGLRWADLRWSTSKLLEPGSTYLSLYGWLHCVFTIGVFLSFLYVVGLVARSDRFTVLLEWSVIAPNIRTRLWPVTVDNALHFHLPITVIALLGVELLVVRRRHQLPMANVYKCMASSFCFYWVLYGWLFFHQDGGRMLGVPQPATSASGGGTGGGTPAAAGIGQTAVLLAASTAKSGVYRLFDDLVRSTGIHWQIMATPALWMVILLPPPAFLAVRLLSFPRFLPRMPNGVSRGSLLARTLRAVLWMANALVISVTTVFTCHVLSTLSSRPAMLALLNWHEAPPGATFEFPDHWALYTRAALFYYLPLVMTLSVFVLRLALLLSHREHPTAFVQHVVLDAVFLVILVAWVRAVLGIEISWVDGCLTPALVCVAVCLGRMLVAFHYNFWRESVAPTDEELEDEIEAAAAVPSAVAGSD